MKNIKRMCFAWLVTGMMTTVAHAAEVQGQGDLCSGGEAAIVLSAGGHDVSGRLEGNATARDFASLLPLTMKLHDLFSREKAGELPRRLSEKGPRSDRYQVGDLAYWSPNRDLAIYYAQDQEKIPAPGIIKLGHLQGDMGFLSRAEQVEVTLKGCLPGPPPR